MIKLERVRELHLPRKGGIPDFFCSASGLVLRGDTAIVVADDSLTLGSFPIHSEKPGVLREIFPGELPADSVERKKLKPDLESVFELTVESERRKLIAVPSGSKKSRIRGSWLGSEKSHELDFTDLYVRLRRSIVELNIEGAIELGPSVYFFHRGNSAGSENSIVRLDRTEFAEDAKKGRIGERCLRKITSIQLGSLAGVRLTFGDAAVDPDGRVWFLASAEKTDNANDDGAYSGAILGRLDASLERVKEVYPIDSPTKPEGLAFDPSDGNSFYVVTDADDPQAVSLLLRGRLADTGVWVLSLNGGSRTQKGLRFLASSKF
jgi:hypothetical protein